LRPSRYKLTPAEALEEAQSNYDQSFSSYSETMKRLAEAKKVGTDEYGHTVPYLETQRKEELKWLEQDAAELAAARAKVGKITPQ